MTIDERIEKLTTTQERMQDDFDVRQKALQVSQEKTQVIMADILDSLKRLERIALAHTLDIDDIQSRLDELEQRRRKKPQ